MKLKKSSKLKKALLLLAITLGAAVLTYNAVVMVRWRIDSRNIAEEAAEIEEATGTKEIDEYQHPITIRPGIHIGGVGVSPVMPPPPTSP